MVAGNPERIGRNKDKKIGFTVGVKIHRTRQSGFKKPFIAEAWRPAVFDKQSVVHRVNGRS